MLDAIAALSGAVARRALEVPVPARLRPLPVGPTV
jgi:hypothetical protein